MDRLQVAGEAGSAVHRAKVQDWQPREPPRSAGGLSAWADGLTAYLQVLPRTCPAPPCCCPASA